jgi:hypothetical protein
MKSSILSLVTFLTEGGMLLVDEAYQLVPTEASTNWTRGSGNNKEHNRRGTRDFGQTTCLYFSGCEMEMQRLLSVNPGLQRRVTNTLLFKDYSTAELVRISFSE